MAPRFTSIALAVVILGTGAFAVLRADSAPPQAKPEAPGPAPEHGNPALPVVAGHGPSDSPALPPGHPSIGEGSSLPSDSTTLPPGHPSIGAGGSMQGGSAPQANDDPPSITWKAPGAWTAAANPSSMRLATYHVPRAPGDTEDADVGLTRAGGTTDANIERWLGQFDDRGKETRTEKVIHGLKVTIVEVSGTYLGGMMSGAATSHHGWALLAAIVEAPGTPYFLKMTGPAATVRAARAPFNALLDSVTPI